MGHVVKDFKTHNETEIILMLLVVKYGAVDDLNLARAHQSPMVRQHGLFALFGEKGRDLNEHILRVPVQI